MDFRPVRDPLSAKQGDLHLRNNIQGCSLASTHIYSPHPQLTHTYTQINALRANFWASIVCNKLSWNSGAWNTPNLMHPAVSIRTWSPSWGFLTQGHSWSYRQNVVCSWGHLKAWLAIDNPFPKELTCVAAGRGTRQGASWVFSQHGILCPLECAVHEKMETTVILPLQGCSAISRTFYWMTSQPCSLWEETQRDKCHVQASRGHLQDCLLWVIIQKRPWNYFVYIQKRSCLKKTSPCCLTAEKTPVEDFSRFQIHGNEVSNLQG